MIARTATENGRAGRNQEAYRGFRVAAASNSYAEIYSTTVARSLKATAAETEDNEESIRIYRLAYDALENFQERNPYAVDAQRVTLLVLAGMVSRGGTGVKDEIATRAAKLAAEYPPYALIQAEAAQAMVVAGRYEDAMRYSDQALRLGARSNTVIAAALWARGVALHNLERYDEAVTTLEQALDTDPSGSYVKAIHRALAKSYGELGNLNEALQHALLGTQ